MRRWLLNRYGEDELALPWSIYFWVMGMATGAMFGFIAGAFFVLGVVYWILVG